MRVYLDHNATTPMRAEVEACWLATARSRLGNPSSLHASGRRARALVDDARARVASALEVQEDEVFFTSGATEANNLALLGALETAGPTAGLVTTTVEHSSVLETARVWQARGGRLTLIPVDASGLPDPLAMASAAGDSPANVVSVTAANNETGAMPDLVGIASALRRLPGQRPALHVDAAQALGRIHVRLGQWGADLASFSAHKLGGPSGVGVLWRRRGVALEPRLFGGNQELGLRPGTENVPGIVATALAIELAVREQSDHADRVAGLTRFLWIELCSAVSGLRLLGPEIGSPRRLPNTLCVLVPDTDGKVLVTRLDLAGLEVSAGSACASGAIEPSHVLLAMGLSRDEARSGLRLSLGRSTTHEECKLAIAVFHKEFSSSHAT